MTRLRSSKLALPFLSLAPGLLLACSAAVTGGSPGANAQTVTVSVLPDSAEVVPSGSVQFVAAVTGSIDTSVDWKVVESGGGTVSTSGLYVAPSQTGTFHVQVASHASPDVSAQATVVVTPTPVVAVTISPRTATVAAGGTATFTAIVTGTSNTSVTWSLRETSGCGTISGGTYTAPAAGGTCHVVATSVADPTKSDTATITVTPPVSITVAISPASGAADACTTLSFRATVTGSSDTTVTWSVLEGTTGGSITSAGVYTAPSNAGTYHVVATSRASSSSRAQATVTVTERIVSVSVAPSNVSLQAGQTAQFTATVVTTCGSFATMQAVTAPAN